MMTMSNMPCAGASIKVGPHVTNGDQQNEGQYVTGSLGDDENIRLLPVSRRA